MGGVDETEDSPCLGKNLRITVAASQGGRRYMEDRCLVHVERNEDKTIKWTFVGVFDGHGGEHASEFVRQNLLDNICKNSKFESKDDKEVLESIREGFLTTHHMMRDVHDEWPYTASGYPSTAGTTVSCVFIRNGKLYTGHVGDSAIYLGEVGVTEVRSVPLTIDHKPESITEQLRIQRAGGSTAVKSGVTRVVWCRPTKSHQGGPIRRNSPMETIPFLSVARSLGDLWSYCETTKTYVVSPDPDVDVHILQKQDFCLVLASDGLTNVLTGDHAVNIVYREEESVEFENDVNRNHARCLLRTALQKWRSLRADNVTVAAVLFDADRTSYQNSEILKKLSSHESCDQALTDSPDAMVHVTNEESTLLSTQRTPVIYNGSKDINFCRVSYRGPGFRTHEEELNEEKKNIMIRKIIRPNILKASPDYDIENDIDYDDDDEDEYREGRAELSLPIKNDNTIKLRVANEIQMSSSSIGRVVEARIVVMESPSRPSAPEPFSPSRNVSTFEPDEGTDEEDDEAEKMENSTPSKKKTKRSPTKTPSGNTVRRVKAEACRRLRTPKAGAVSPTILSPNKEDTNNRILTRSATKKKSEEANLEENKTVVKTAKKTLNKEEEEEESTIPLTPVRRSSRRSAQGTKENGSVTPKSLKTPKSHNGQVGSAGRMSRKRGRAEMINNEEEMNQKRKTTGITPAIGNMTVNTQTIIMTRSAPSTPKKTTNGNNQEKGIRTSKWSLSKLDTPKATKEDGIIRVSERADDYEGEEEGDDDDTIVEPPSKIRRIYGFVKRLVGWPSQNR